MKNSNIQAIVSYEPGSGFPFPVGEIPDPIENSADPLVAVGVPKQEFLKLTQIPIVIYYGDNIPAEPDPGLYRQYYKAVNPGRYSSGSQYQQLE